MFGPLQARPSCLCRYLPQAVGPYGSSLPCVAPRAASHEAIPFVDEGAEVTPHCTSYSPYQSVAQLLSTPVNVARPRLSPERGENVFEGRRRVEGRVPLLAYKLPGTQGCLPGFEVFSPHSRGASYYSQDGQYGRTLDRLARHLLLWSQDKFLSLRAVHVPGVLNLAADFLSRQKLEPGEWMLNRQTVSQIWDLFGKAEVDLFASNKSHPSARSGSP